MHGVIRGVDSREITQINDAHTSSLSATGSRNAPYGVHTFHRRARIPSTKSVIALTANIPLASIRELFRYAIASIGVLTTRALVSMFGIFRCRVVGVLSASFVALHVKIFRCACTLPYVNGVLANVSRRNILAF